MMILFYRMKDSCSCFALNDSNGLKQFFSIKWWNWRFESCTASYDRSKAMEPLLQVTLNLSESFQCYLKVFILNFWNNDLQSSAKWEQGGPKEEIGDLLEPKIFYILQTSIQKPFIRCSICLFLRPLATDVLSIYKENIFTEDRSSSFQSNDYSITSNGQKLWTLPFSKCNPSNL